MKTQIWSEFTQFAIHQAVFYTSTGIKTDCFFRAMFCLLSNYCDHLTEGEENGYFAFHWFIMCDVCHGLFVLPLVSLVDYTGNCDSSWTSPSLLFFFFFFFVEIRTCMIDWLCWGLTTCQPLRVILCRLPEKGRKEIEERVEEMKERDREERGTGKKVKKQKK